MGLLPAAAADVRQDGHGRGGDRFEEALEHAKQAKGVRNDVELDEGDLRRLVEEFKAIIAAEAGRSSPRTRSSSPAASRPCSAPGTTSGRSTTGARTRSTTRSARAVNIQAMVFGNKGEDSGTGVAFTRNPANGEPPYGDYLVNAQGEDVVAGIRNTMKLEEMGDVQPRPGRSSRSTCRPWRATTATCATSSSPSSRASCGCSRPGSASAPPWPSGSWPTTCARRSLIDVDTALLRLDANRLEELFKKVIAAGAAPTRSPRA